MYRLFSIIFIGALMLFSFQNCSQSNPKIAAKSDSSVAATSAFYEVCESAKSQIRQIPVMPGLVHICDRNYEWSGIIGTQAVVCEVDSYAADAAESLDLAYSQKILEIEHVFGEEISKPLAEAVSAGDVYSAQLKEDEYYGFAMILEGDPIDPIYKLDHFNQRFGAINSNTKAILAAVNFYDPGAGTLDCNSIDIEKQEDSYLLKNTGLRNCSENVRIFENGSVQMENSSGNAVVCSN